MFEVGEYLVALESVFPKELTQMIMDQLKNECAVRHFTFINLEPHLTHEGVIDIYHIDEAWRYAVWDEYYLVHDPYTPLMIQITTTMDDWPAAGSSGVIDVIDGRWDEPYCPWCLYGLEQEDPREPYYWCFICLAQFEV